MYIPGGDGAIIKMSDFQTAQDGHAILLVDDEPSIRLALSMLLEEEGYRVVTAGNGQEALSKLDEKRPDLIITDYMMPYLTGTQLIQAVRTKPGCDTIPILLMSAALPYDLNPDEVADAFFEKPADLSRLLAVIDQLINPVGKQQEAP